MDVIEVPEVPQKAFNKHRRISDLIRAQVNHLKHLEYKLPPSVKSGVPKHAIETENQAAMYIAAMTRLLRELGGAAEKPAGGQGQVLAFPQPTTGGLDIAAGAGEQQMPAGEGQQENVTGERTHGKKARKSHTAKATVPAGEKGTRRARTSKKRSPDRGDQ